MMPAMGWYEAAIRPLLFGMPPEAAHRTAMAMLGLPLPLRRIAGPPPDPALGIDLAGIPLASPIGMAAGFDKTCRRLDALGALGFGFVVGGTITRAPRRGNPRPRIVRDRARGSMTNAMGLPNPGARAAAAAIARQVRTVPRLVSLADEAIDDALAALGWLEPHVDGLELNASCPNVSWGRDRDQEAHLRELLTALRARTAKPLFVKLPPFMSATEREVVVSLASIAEAAGADGLVCANTRPVDDVRLSTGRGGMSGEALRDRTPAIVAEVRAVTDAPIVACGGISAAADVVASLEAGATAVQVYTSFVYQGPHLPGRLARELASELRGRGLTLQELVGSPSATG